MDIGAVGSLLIFFSILIALILVGLLALSYAAYSFLVTLTSTAAGNDEIIWPGEPIQDWLFKVWYLGWLLAVCAAPATLLVGALGLSKPLSALCLAGALWLVFPVVLLSSLSAPSRFIILRPVIVWMLLSHLGATLRFYAGSGFIVLACAALVFTAVFGLRGMPLLDQPLITVPLAAVVTGAGCLIYARLLGRLAFIVSQTHGEKRKKHRQERSEEADRVESFDPWSSPEEEDRVEERAGPHRRPPKGPAKKNKLRAGRTNQAFDPWAMPADEPIRKKTKPSPSPAAPPEDPYGPAEGTYEILPEAVAPSAAESSPSHSRLDREEVKPYAVSASSDGGPPNLPPVQPEISKLEEELAAPRRLPPLPKWPLVTGVYGFPFYPQTVGPCGTVMLGFLAVIGLARLLLFVFPF
jgi:hypothetical protein